MDSYKTAIMVGLIVTAVCAFSSLRAQAEESVTAANGKQVEYIFQTREMPVRGPIPFNSYDQNNDGFISEVEFSAARAARMAARASEGRPMRGAASAPAFELFDSDSDGLLTREELNAGQQSMMGKRRGMGMNQGQGRGMNGGMNKGMNMPSYSDFDLNGDGTIPEAEFNAAREKRINERKAQGYQMRNLDNILTFSSIDTNNDGEISIEEFSKHQQRQRQW